MEAVQLRRDRAEVIRQAGAIITAAQNGKRDLTTEERADFDKLHARADAQLVNIEAIEKQQRAELDLRASRTLNPRGESMSTDEVPTGPALEKRHSMAAWATAKGHPVEEYRNLGLGDWIRAVAVGPRTDAERRALAEGTPSAGGYTVPVITLARYIDKLRARTVCFKAGATLIPLETAQTSIAKLSADPTAAWRSENASVGTSDPTFQTVTFTARNLTGLVVVSRELLEDSLNAGPILENAFAKAFSVELDRACLFGSGTPPEPQGIFGTSGIASVSMGTNGAAPANYDPVLSLRQALLDANAAEPTAYVMAPRTATEFAKLKDTTNQPMDLPTGLEAPFMMTTSVPVTQTQGSSGAVASCVVAGDFTELYIGMRTSFNLTVLKERYADLGQVGLWGWLRADIGVAHAASFGKLIGIL